MAIGFLNRNAEPCRRRSSRKGGRGKAGRKASVVLKVVGVFLRRKVRRSMSGSKKRTIQVHRTLAAVYKLQLVKCGKGCSGCPHGPYWYAYYRRQYRGTEGKLVSREICKYIGKSFKLLPFDTGEPAGKKGEERGIIPEDFLL